MDDPFPSSLIIAAMVVLAIGRLLNNTLKAAYFSMSSIAVFALAEKVRAGDERLAAFLTEPSRMSICTQLFDKISLLLMGVCLYVLHPDMTWVLAGAALVYLLVFDLALPNRLGPVSPENLVTKLFTLFRWPYTVLQPFTFVMTNGNKRRWDDEDEEDPEEVSAFLKAGAEEGIIEEKEELLLRNLLTFNDTIVREIMVPRTEMVCVEIGTTRTDFYDIFRRTKHSRLPVYKDDIDHIVGVLRLKDITGAEDTASINDILTDALFVPEKRLISDLLQDMLKRRLQMAIVIDEYGGTAGLITLEDLIEEIVGEIHEEHEPPEGEEITPLGDGLYEVDARMLLEDFCTFFNLPDVDEDDVDTVGGFIFNQEGRIPHVGHVVELNHLRIKILEADERRIFKLLVRDSQNQEVRESA